MRNTSNFFPIRASIKYFMVSNDKKTSVWDDRRYCVEIAILCQFSCHILGVGVFRCAFHHSVCIYTFSFLFLTYCNPFG